MNVLVTGASGFLGRRIVTALLRRGHTVRALVRAYSTVGPHLAAADVLAVDLLSGENLEPAFRNVEVLIHLAVPVMGEDPSAIATTGTRNLLAAAAASPLARLVLASSVVVYDWARVSEEVTEETPLATSDCAALGPYARAKLDQELIAREHADRLGWSLAVLRPAVIWGPGRRMAATVGPRLGPFRLVLGPRRELRLTFVDNCADAFVAAAESDLQGTINVADGDGTTAWTYARSVLARGDGVCLPVPWSLARGLSVLGNGLGRIAGKEDRLPDALRSSRFEARYHRTRVSTRRAREELGWQPQVDFDRAVAATAGGGAQRVGTEM